MNDKTGLELIQEHYSKADEGTHNPSSFEEYQNRLKEHREKLSGIELLTLGFAELEANRKKNEETKDKGEKEDS